MTGKYLAFQYVAQRDGCTNAGAMRAHCSGTMNTVKFLAAAAAAIAIFIGAELAVGYWLIHENDRLTRLRAVDAELCQRMAPVVPDNRAVCLSIPHEQLAQWLKDTHDGIDNACRGRIDGNDYRSDAQWQQCMREHYPNEWAQER